MVFCTCLPHCGPACSSYLALISEVGIDIVSNAGKRQVAAGRKKRVMVLMSDTGGGHRASAEALQAGFEQLYGNDFQVSPLNTFVLAETMYLVSLACAWLSAY